MTVRDTPADSRFKQKSVSKRGGNECGTGYSVGRSKQNEKVKTERQ